jgi:hypothetical protein
VRAFVLVATLVVALVACVPATAPTTDAAAGVLLTARPIDGAVTYRVEVNPSVDRLFLRFVGEGLAVNATECVVTEAAVECVVGAIQSFYVVTIGGTVTNDPGLPYGVACRAAGCSALYLEVPNVE